MERVNEESHRFSSHSHVYPQVVWVIPRFTGHPQSIATIWPVRSSRAVHGRTL